MSRIKVKGNEIVKITELGGLRSIEILNLSRNHITDVAPIVKLVELKYLNLGQNRITDLTPLVENEGLGEGGVVYLQNNFLDFSLKSTDLRDIRTLKSRGVQVTFFPQRTQQKSKD